MTKTELDSELALRRQMAYSYVLRREDDGTWFGEIAELPGCMTAGDTRIETLAMLDEAFEAWISTALEDGFPIPDPAQAEPISISR